MSASCEREAPVLDGVIADLVARAELGNERYGRPLLPFNGRDGLRDAYEEALDLSMYLKQLLLERDELDRRRQELIVAIETHGDRRPLAAAVARVASIRKVLNA